MRRSIALAAVLAATVGVGAIVLATASGGNSDIKFDGDGPVTMAVYGDAPYGTNPADTAEFNATPAFIDAVNKDDKVKMVVHVGDIHSGKQYCTFAYDESIFNLWTQYKDPLVYTPGDNEWSDCHKTTEGGNVVDTNGNYADYANGNPVANLGLVRQIFFSQRGHLLGNVPGDKTVLSQADANNAHPDDAQFVENVMWEQAKTLFVSVNLPGGSNNDADLWYGASPASGEQVQEQKLRTQADVDWLNAAFARASTDGVNDVVIITQADMWDTTDSAAHQTNYEPFITAIATGTTAFAKPVLLFNGDSHIYRSDDPLQPHSTCTTESGPNVVPCTTDAYGQHPGYNVPNFHRVVVHGSTFPLEYLRFAVDPNGNPPHVDAAHPAPTGSFGPFSWTRVQP